MGKKLFVGGLPWATDDVALRNLFEPYGAVADAKIITDRETGRSRGFGFVTFADDKGTSKAILEMNGKSVGGRTINVNEAEDRRGAPSNGGGGGYSGGGGGYSGGGGGGHSDGGGRRDRDSGRGDRRSRDEY